MKFFKFVFIFLVLGILSFSAPKSKLIPYWNASNEKNLQVINHDEFQIFLSKYVVKDGEHYLVNYKNVSSADKTRLENYIKTLENINILSYSKKEQFPYWVNLYNAATINLILDNYPTKSILSVGSSFRRGPWNNNILKVNNKELSLNDIEHGILRPIWKDPRIHFAVNCASLGCPNLSPLALNSSNYLYVLDILTTEFINSKRALSLDNDTLLLSSIFDWYSVDFGGNEKSVLRYIQLHSMKNISNLKYKKIKYHYDWDLNEVK